MKTDLKTDLERVKSSSWTLVSVSSALETLVVGRKNADMRHFLIGLFKAQAVSQFWGGLRSLQPQSVTGALKVPKSHFQKFKVA